MSCPSERRHSKSQLAIFSDFYRVRLKNEKRKTAVGEQNSPHGKLFLLNGRISSVIGRRYSASARIYSAITRLKLTLPENNRGVPEIFRPFAEDIRGQARQGSIPAQPIIFGGLCPIMFGLLPNIFGHFLTARIYSSLIGLCFFSHLSPKIFGHSWGIMSLTCAVHTTCSTADWHAEWHLTVECVCHAFLLVNLS